MAMAAILRSSAKKKPYLRIFPSYPPPPPPPSSSSSLLTKEEVTAAHRHRCFVFFSSRVFASQISLPFEQYSSPSGLKMFSSAATAGRSSLFQKMFRSISTMRNPTHSPLLRGDKDQPVPSPLTMVPTPSDSPNTTPTTEPVKRAVQAVLKKIKESPKKVNLVASLVRGMRVEDALAQLSVLQKRAAKTVKRVVWNARSNATHNHGLNGDRLYVAEAFVGKGKYLKRISMHAKGRSGIMHHPSCRLTVVVKELNQDQETQIAKYQSMTFRERAKVKSKLFPHKLIEVTPQWSRRTKESASSTLEV